MKKEVGVLDADKKECENLCSLLAENNYQAESLDSISEMEAFLAKTDCRAVILNLDNTCASNESLRKLKQKNPFISIIALSERQFHPELEESLREYISVCLAKPVNVEELTFWLRSIFKNAGPNDPSGARASEEI